MGPAFGSFCYMRVPEPGLKPVGVSQPCLLAVLNAEVWANSVLDTLFHSFVLEHRWISPCSQQEFCGHFKVMVDAKP